MDPNYEWNFENGSPVSLKSAFGIGFSEPIPMDRLTEINGDVMEAVALYVEESEKTRLALEKATTSTNKSEQLYMSAFMNYQIRSFASDEEIAAINYRPHALEGLSIDERNRALVVQNCEEFVRVTIDKNPGLGVPELDVSLPKLVEYCSSKLEFVDETFSTTLFRILIADGWILFNNTNNKSVMVPYGIGVPGYDDRLGVYHPFWDTL